jgi:NADH-quinone oxidoreductase subunit J
MNLTPELITLFVLSSLAIGGAVFMIQSTRVVHMAIALAFTFFSLGGIYFTLDAEFLAVVQILIYAGAVSILMLFGIMLTRRKEEEEEESRNPNKLHPLFSFFAVALFFLPLTWLIYHNPILGETLDHKQLETKKLGTELFTTYLLPFEITSVLLLVALIGAIILAKREGKE